MRRTVRPVPLMLPSSFISFAGASESDHLSAKHWRDMHADFSTCKSASKQSPINIQTPSVESRNLGRIRFDYNSTPLRIINNGHTIQVNYSSA